MQHSNPETGGQKVSLYLHSVSQFSMKIFLAAVSTGKRLGRLQMVRKCLAHLFVGLDIVLRAVQPLVLLPQRPTPSAGLRFTLPERLGVYTLRHPLFIYTTRLWEGKCC